MIAPWNQAYENGNQSIKFTHSQTGTCSDPFLFRALHDKVKEHNDTIGKLVDEKELFQAQIGELKNFLVIGTQRIADNEEELMQTQQQLRVVAKFTVVRLTNNYSVLIL